MALSQSVGSPASTKQSSSRGRGGKAPPLRWLPTPTCAGNWKMARTTPAQSRTTQSCWCPWSAACRSCGPPRTGWSPPTTGCGVWPAAGSSPRWRCCWSTSNMASKRALAARSFTRSCWREGGPGAKCRSKSQRGRDRALWTGVKVQDPVSSCFRHSHGQRSNELEVMCPALRSPPAPQLLLSRPSGPQPRVQGERMRAGEGSVPRWEGREKGQGTHPPKGTAFQLESISKPESSVSDGGCKT